MSSWDERSESCASTFERLRSWNHRPAGSEGSGSRGPGMTRARGYPTAAPRQSRRFTCALSYSICVAARHPGESSSAPEAPSSVGRVRGPYPSALRPRNRLVVPNKIWECVTCVSQKSATDQEVRRRRRRLWKPRRGNASSHTCRGPSSDGPEIPVVRGSRPGVDGGSMRAPEGGLYGLGPRSRAGRSGVSLRAAGLSWRGRNRAPGAAAGWESAAAPGERPGALSY